MSEGVPSNSGLILFAHGARDGRWAEPFERVAALVRGRAPEVSVALAYLEHLSPTLVEAVAGLASRGVSNIRVVPLFFGRGGHLREDLPAQLESAHRAFPDVRLALTEAAGEDAEIQDALATFALRGLAGNN